MEMEAAVTRTALSELASLRTRHYDVHEMTPPEKLDMQTVDTQCRLLFQFLTSLLRFRSGWFANHALQRTAAGHRSCNRRASWPPSLSLVR